MEGSLSVPDVDGGPKLKEESANGSEGPKGDD